MIYSPLIQKAITFAIKVHHTDAHQVRKGSDIPYITHPLAVAPLLARVTKDEEIIVAGILHDTIEDCKPYGSVTKEMIEELFGPRVARMVNDLTEQDKSLSWEERKMMAMAHIKDMEHDSQLVKATDILYNLTDVLNDIEVNGRDKAFSVFGATQDVVMDSYRKRINELARVWPANPLMSELKAQVEKLTEV